MCDRSIRVTAMLEYASSLDVVIKKCLIHHILPSFKCYFSIYQCKLTSINWASRASTVAHVV